MNALNIALLQRSVAMKTLGAWLRGLEIAFGVLAIFCWLAALAWLRHLTAPDEGRYVGVALEMLRTGDWLVPRLDGLPFFHKPPLFYWIGASAMSIFGVSAWAARLPSLLGATAAASSLWLFLRRWDSVPAARIAVQVFLTLPFLYLGAQFANLDMLVAGCITVTILLAAHAALAREADAPWQVSLALAFASAAIGVLAKGLIGLLLPGVVFIGWVLAARRPGRLWMLAWWPGWLLFVVIALPWFVAMQLRYAEFFDYFVVTQHFRRFAAGGFNNVEPVWFYVPAIVLLTLPWSGWLAVRPGRQWRLGLSDIDRLMLVWLVVIVAFFSLPRSKLLGYVLPALPPLAYLIARAMQRVQPAETDARRSPRWTAGAAAIVCVLAVLMAERFGSPPGARLPLPAGSAIGPDDQVLMLDAYVYELPFYWRLPHPAMVLSDWDDPAIAQRDNWRKEMSDAARFDPEQGRSVLIRTGNAASVLCVARTTWLVGPRYAARSWSWLNDPRFLLVAQNSQLAVWRFAGATASEPRCLAGDALRHLPAEEP